MALRSGLQSYLRSKNNTSNSFGILLSKQLKGALGTTSSSITNSYYRSFYYSPSSSSSTNNVNLTYRHKNYYNDKTKNQVSFFSTTTNEDDADFVDGKPTLKYVTTKPRAMSMMRHEEIIQLSAEGVQDAIIECLIREIMMVDQVEYDLAVKKFEEIKEKNAIKPFSMMVLPYKGGLTFAATASILSTIMVFHLPMVKWFNEHYVTMEVPPPSELDTALEVGSWSWSWMEPIVGQASFVLLCMQLGRSQMQNMGLKPYTSFMKDRHATALADAYPQYNPKILKQYSQSVTLY